MAKADRGVNSRCYNESMFPRAMFATLIVCMTATLLAQESSELDNVLVWYDFESDGIETGPYTLWVFDSENSSVSLSTDYRVSGFRSVEIRDAAGDRNFAELQGFFTDKWSGKLYIHFAFLVAEPKETFHMAFAGVSHFTMQEHGLGIWLEAENGTLSQITAGRREPLFEIEAFVWYVADILYDVDQGTYDIVIKVEGQKAPVVALEAQTNTVGIPGSSLRKYSFIGDLPGRDGSNAWFYVDDILVMNDRPVSESPFVAPGRRMLFVDLYDRYKASLYEKPRCVPVFGYEDFGLSSQDLQELAGSGRMDLLEPPSGGEPPKFPRGISTFLRERLLAKLRWHEGCEEPARARELFHASAEQVPDAKIYPMSEVLVLAGEKRWDEADALFLSIYSSWQDDPRFPALSATLGLARGDLDEAERWLSASVEVVPQELNHTLARNLWERKIHPRLIDQLRAEFPSNWHHLVETALMTELRFYVLLWQKRYDEAGYYAQRMAILYERMKTFPQPLARAERRRRLLCRGLSRSAVQLRTEPSLPPEPRRDLPEALRRPLQARKPGSRARLPREDLRQPQALRRSTPQASIPPPPASSFLLAGYGEAR